MKEKEIYPKNKSYFKKLIPFAKKIILICKDNKINPIIYGSYAHFYYTKDRGMDVNDIDMIIPKKDFPKIKKLLRKGIKANIISDGGTIIIKSEKLKVELDEVGEYKTLNEKALSKNIFNKIDFYGIEVRIITLKQIEEIYPVAYNNSINDKDMILEKIKRLEKFLDRKIKQEIFVEVVKNKNLTKTQKETINHARVSHWGEVQRKDFNKDYEPDALWFFVKKKNRVVSLGGIRPIKVEYLGKKYNIGGICSTISLEKKKGYGKIMVYSMINYSKKTGKTLLGFTGKTEFFKKAGLETKKNFIKRFRYKNPKTGKIEIDNEGDGIYYEGKDKFISNVLSNKSLAYIDVPFW